LFVFVFVFAFAGRVEADQQLLDGALRVWTMKPKLLDSRRAAAHGSP
jgi:hypothetical protein